MIYDINEILVIYRDFNKFLKKKLLVIHSRTGFLI